MRLCPLLLCALLPGCLTQELWQADLRSDVGVEVTTARFEVTEMHLAELRSVDAQRGAVPARELVIEAVMRSGRRGDETSWMVPSQPTFVLRPFDESGPDAIAGLLQGSDVGLVDRCDLSIDWNSGVDAAQCFIATVELEGWLSPRLLHARIDAATAASLLASPRTVPVDDDDPVMQRRLADIDRVDWRVLCPDQFEGSAKVLACCFDPDTGSDTAADRMTGAEVLVQVGAAEHRCYLRVPVAALPLLAHVHRRDDTLLPRFRCEQHFLAVLRPGGEPRSGPLPLPAGTMLVLNSRRHSQVDWQQLHLKEILTPLAAIGDAALWVLKHGPLAPLFPQKVGRRVEPPATRR